MEIKPGTDDEAKAKIAKNLVEQEFHAPSASKSSAAAPGD